MILKVKCTTEVEIRTTDSKAVVNLNSKKEDAIREALTKLLAQMTSPDDRAEENGDSRFSESTHKE